MKGYVRATLARIQLAAFLALCTVGCTFGPGQLERGHLVYNAAVNAAADRELLLNLVRLRYLDTLDFMTTTSISSQLSISVSAGARGGSDTLSGTMGALGEGSFSYSSRPTFTFTPQRGHDFGQRLIEPVPISLIAYLAAGDWDMRLLLRLFVRRLNELDNELGQPNKAFVDVTDRISRLQIKNQIFVGFEDASEPVSDPIPAAYVSGSDIVEAAKSGFEFRRNMTDGGFVLTTSRSQPILVFHHEDEDAQAVVKLLGLNPDMPTYALKAGTSSNASDKIVARTGSLIRALVYLSQGVSIPDEHLQAGLTTREWPPGAPGIDLSDLFTVRFAKSEPDTPLSVEYRGYWFYLADNDLTSRYTFFTLAELFRIGLTHSEGQAAPVLTLPVGQ